MTPDDPHADGDLLTGGAPPAAAEAAVVLLHGRGDSASNLLRLADEFHAHGLLHLAPEAEGRRWFPWAPENDLARNEPWLSSAVDAVERALDTAREAGVPPERTLLFGFSQGATLAGEVAVRRPRRYGGVAMLAGGLLGSDVAARTVDGSLDGTPAFLGWGRDDPAFDPERADASADVLAAGGAAVTDRRYDDLGHAINDAETAAVRALVDDLL
ncbi:alpha/beta hydrolase [Halorarius halobius]|uniref:alpha/beta hydrolase n=1 Tax=Halorarius halobius TaxID=2962671 RepID=UPI0020CF12F3|nr:phospholipase [Halorarius halobius]